MSIIGKWDTSELDSYLHDIKKGLSQENIQKFNEDTVKEIAARTLAKIIARTPVGEYGTRQVEFTTKDGKEVSFTAHSNKVGGTLRRGWTAGKDIDPYDFIMSNTEVIKKGNVYMILISNLTEYGPHVEYGHRTVSGGFIDGQYMMTISMDEMQDELPELLNKKFTDFLGVYFDD